MKKNLLAITTLLFALVSLGAFAQVPVITYSPASSPLSPITLTQNSSNNLPLTPTPPTGVGTFGYSSTGVQLSGTSLNYPWGIGIDPNDAVYVVNYNSLPGTKHNAGSGGTISEYNSSQVYQGLYGNTTNLQQPTGIVFDNTGNGYILNYALSDNGNQKGNAYIEQFSPSGADNGPVITTSNYPATGLAIDASNNLYVAYGSGSSTSNISEYVIGNNLPFLVITAPSGSNFSAVGVDGSYNIYALDNANNQVFEYSSTGVLLKTVLVGPTYVNNPNAFYVDGAGDIFVGNTGSGSGFVTIYNPNLPTGSNIFTINGFSDPRGIATDSKGNLYVSDIGNNTVTRFAPNGGYFISGQLPPGLTFDSTTGTISGKPTSGFATTTYKITGYNSYGYTTTSVSLKCLVNISISYSPAINVYTIGTPITALSPQVTGTPASNGFSIIPSSLPAGLSFNKNTGVISGTPTTASAASLYTISVTDGTNTAQATVSIACVKDNYWTGKISTDWNTPGNWSALHVPTSGERASIGVVYDYKNKKGIGNDPLVSTGTASSPTLAYYVTFGSLTTSESLTVKSGATFAINNILTVNSGASPAFITGSGGGSISFLPTSVLYVYGNLSATDNLITLQSNASSSASLGAMPTGATVTGAVNVQRYIPGIRGWVLLTSPVNAGTVNTTSVYDLNYLLNSTYVTGTGFSTSTFSKPGNPSLFLYRENFLGVGNGYAQSNYRAVTSLSGTTVNTLDGAYTVPIGNGYQLYFRGGTGTTSPYTSGSTAQPATLTTTGTLNQGSVTFTHWYTPGAAGLMYSTTSGSVNIEGFNLVGNPYACTIDLDSYSYGGISMSNVSQYIYELNPQSGNYEVYTLGSGTSDPLRYIASGQGFFVQATGTSATLTFNETCKNVGQQNTGTNLLLSKGPVATVVPQYLRLRMGLDSINTDETVIKFNDQAKTNYVFNEDALYMPGNGRVSLSSVSSDNRPMAINTRPLATRGDTIKLKVSAANGTYSISMNAIKGIPQLYDIWLMDAYKKDSLDLRHNSTYSFDVTRADTNTYGSNRFKIIMRQNPAYAYHLLNFTASKATGRQVQLVWNTENEANYTHFTVQRSTDGGKTYDVVGGIPSTGAGQYALLDKNPGENNLYRLQQIDINNNITYSQIIPIGFANQNGGLTNNTINVYPNPARSIINLAVNADAGTSASYRIRIVNNTGLIVKEVISTQASWQGNIGNLLPGTYIVRVMNDKTQSFVGESKLIKL